MNKDYNITFMGFLKNKKKQLQKRSELLERVKKEFKENTRKLPYDKKKQEYLRIRSKYFPDSRNELSRKRERSFTEENENHQTKRIKVQNSMYYKGDLNFEIGKNPKYKKKTVINTSTIFVKKKDEIFDDFIDSIYNDRNYRKRKRVVYEEEYIGINDEIYIEDEENSKRRKIKDKCSIYNEKELNSFLNETVY